MDFTTHVKMEIYERISQTAVIPGATQIALQLQAPLEAVEEAIHRLAEKRLLVLEPGGSSIRMAPPFSAVPTLFRVVVDKKAYDANCIWDAYGVSAAMHQDAVIETSDGFTGESMSLSVQNGKPGLEEAVVHFAVPAARWWEDIVYT